MKLRRYKFKLTLKGWGNKVAEFWAEHEQAKELFAILNAIRSDVAFDINEYPAHNIPIEPETTCA